MSFEPRSIINGKLFREFMGKNVSVMVKIEGDYTGQIIKAKTTDQVPVRISLSEPIGGNPTDWVEVIGVVSGADMLRAKEVIMFEESNQEFDSESHNMLVNIMNNTRDFYATG